MNYKARSNRFEGGAKGDLLAPFGSGIERDATLIEIRLALREYRARHGANHWRLFYQEAGRA